MEGFRFARMLASVSPLRGRAVQVPEHAAWHKHRGGNPGYRVPPRRSPGAADSPRPPPTPAPLTHHHQECRKPGGSPSVMFFSHRICGRKEGAASGLRGSDERGGPRRPPPLARPAQDGGREAAAEHKGRRGGSPRTGRSAPTSGRRRAAGTRRRIGPACKSPAAVGGGAAGRPPPRTKPAAGLLPHRTPPLPPSLLLPAYFSRACPSEGTAEPFPLANMFRAELGGGPPARAALPAPLRRAPGAVRAPAPTAPPWPRCRRRRCLPRPPACRRSPRRAPERGRAGHRPLLIDGRLHQSLRGGGGVSRGHAPSASGGRAASRGGEGGGESAAPRGPSAARRAGRDGRAEGRAAPLRCRAAAR